MPARRCPHCSTPWPDLSDYDPCPECGVKTALMPYAGPITRAEATKRLREAIFERWYQDRERARERRGEPSPEEIGRQEARTAIELIESAGLEAA